MFMCHCDVVIVVSPQIQNEKYDWINCAHCKMNAISFSFFPSCSPSRFAPSLVRFEFGKYSNFVSLFSLFISRQNELHKNYNFTVALDAWFSTLHCIVYVRLNHKWHADRRLTRNSLFIRVLHFFAFSASLWGHRNDLNWRSRTYFFSSFRFFYFRYRFRATPTPIQWNFLCIEWINETDSAQYRLQTLPFLSHLLVLFSVHSNYWLRFNCRFKLRTKCVCAFNWKSFLSDTSIVLPLCLPFFCSFIFQKTNEKTITRFSIWHVAHVPVPHWKCILFLSVSTVFSLSLVLWLLRLRCWLYARSGREIVTKKRYRHIRHAIACHKRKMPRLFVFYFSSPLA